MKLKIEYVPIDSIKMYDKNAKLHPQEQVEQIKKSITEFGMNDPIGIWNNEIVEGHGRLIACKELGYKEVPIIRLDDLTDEQRRAYMLVHNKLTMNSDFDIELLDIELDNIADIDMEQFGFEINSISPDEYGVDFSLPDGDKPETEYMSFIFHRKQKELITAALESQRGKCQQTFGNKNETGNALYEVVRQWAQQNELL